MRREVAGNGPGAQGFRGNERRRYEAFSGCDFAAVALRVNR